MGLGHARFALRTFGRHGGACLFAIGILALGIGMSVTMFSLVQAVLLRPLPFPHQESLQVIWKTDARTGVPLVELAYPELADLQNLKAFEFVALMPTTLYGYGKVVQSGGHEPVQIESAPVSHDFFRVLGVTPALGRDFSNTDEQVGAAPVVILTHRVWREQFAADPGIIGRPIRLNGVGHTVIGVMAPAVDFPRNTGLWTPLGVTAARENRGASYLQAIARVRPGYSQRRISAMVNGLFRRLARDYAGIYSASQEGVATPLAEYWTGSARRQMWIAMGASLLLLVAACMSAGNLFLSRALGRRREMATRAAVGATPSQILAQLAAEAVTAALMACGAGLALAGATIHLPAVLAPADIPRLAEAALDPEGFAFAAAVALLAAMVCSMTPAWLATRIDPLALLSEGGARSVGTRGGRRTQGAFVLAQAAVTVTLLSTSLSLFASYRAMMRTDVGFANRDALTMNVAVRGPATDARARKAFYSRLLERLREAPGVISAGGVLLRPLEGSLGWDMHYEFEAEAGRRDARQLPAANFEAITPGYLQTVGTRLLEGRDIGLHDTEDGERVAIISKSLAQRLRKSGGDAIGGRLRFGGSADDGWWKIVGVAADARYRRVTETGDDIYVSYLQTNIPTNYLAIRGTLSAEGLASLVRKTVARIDPNQAAAGVATLGELMERDTARHRFNLLLMMWFAVCALALAAAGVYSAIAESVAARTREMALKVALGAGIPRLIREIVGGTLALVLLGEAVGIAGALALGRAASELLYMVSATDVGILAPVVAFLFVVSFWAAFFPAWTAARRDVRGALPAE